MTISKLAKIQVFKVKDLVLCLYGVSKYTTNVLVLFLLYFFIPFTILLTKLSYIDGVVSFHFLHWCI